MHRVGLCRSGSFGFLGKRISPLWVSERQLPEAMSTILVSGQVSWDNAKFQHAIAQRYCNLLNPHSSRPNLKSYQLSSVSVYSHGEQVRNTM